MWRPRKLKKYDMEEAFTDLAECPSGIEQDLPSDDDEGPSIPTKALARLEFESSPSSMLRRSEQGLSFETNLTPDYARRPVDWRWQRVCNAVHRRYGTVVTTSDPWLERGESYLEGLLDCRDDAERAELARREPDLHSAYTLYRSTDKFLRGRLEAYLLGHRPFSDIAAACSVSPATVETYEYLFFEVRSRLKHPMLIQKVAFDGKNCDVAFGGGLNEADIDLILKKAGFVHGGAVLEPMIRYFSSDWQILDEERGPRRAGLVALHEMLAMRKLILVWLAPPQVERATRLNELALELGRLVSGWPEDADAPKKSPFGFGSITKEQFETWWSSWRKLVGLARQLPEGKEPHTSSKKAR